MKRMARGPATGRRTAAMVGLAVTGWALGVAPGSLGRAQAATAMETCRNTLPGKGPKGPVVAKGAPGADMALNVAWEPKDWSGSELAEIVTCVSVADLLAHDLTTLDIAPPNTGSFVRTLTMPFEMPGTLVCQQSLLIGTSSDGVSGIRRTNPVCFEVLAASTSGPVPAPVPAPARAAPVPDAAPARPARVPTPVPAPAPAKAKPSPAPPASRTPDQATAASAAGASPAPAEKPAALARTGPANRAPLATAGALFLLGGVAAAIGRKPAWRRRPGVRHRR